MVNDPFVIFALPRSRTAWLAAWLAYNGPSVGHDLAPFADTCQGFLDRLWLLMGTVETGAETAHRLLRTAMPAAKFVTVRRPVEDVERSLTRLGVTGVREELERRDAVLDEIERDGARSVRFSDLNDACVCADLWEYLLSVPFDFPRWRGMAAQNIRVDATAQLAAIAARRERIDALRAEVAALDGAQPQFLRLGWEPVRPLYPEAQALMAAHSAEVNNGERYGHPLRFNLDLAAQMEAGGFLRIMTARINGVLKGYITWTVSPDIESDGVMLADQGAWYVTPDAPKGLGRKMFRQSIEALKAAGIKSAQLHHQINGRGAKLGTWFRRIGAVEHQHRYTLWLGD